MKKKEENIIKFTAPLREKCGNCYYNGNCKTNLRICPYLKKKNQSIE